MEKMVLSWYRSTVGDKGYSICVCEGSKIITVGLNIVLGYAWNWYFCCIFVGLNS